MGQILPHEVIAHTFGLFRIEAHPTLLHDHRTVRLGLQVYTEASITGVADGQITVTSASAGVDYTVPCSQVINAADMVANTGLLDEVSVAETYAIGDCASPFSIALAIRGGNDAGRAVGPHPFRSARTYLGSRQKGRPPPLARRRPARTYERPGQQVRLPPGAQNAKGAPGALGPDAPFLIGPRPGVLGRGRTLGRGSLLKRT